MHTHLRKAIITKILSEMRKFLDNTRYVDPMGTLLGGLKVAQDATTDL